MSCAQIEHTCALADGELCGSAAAAAKHHLATCADCQDTLADMLQLAAATAGLQPSLGVHDSKTAPIVSLADHRQRRVRIVVLAGAIAAAAGLALYLAFPDRRAPATPHVASISVQLAAHRSLEARLAWKSAASYRDYDVPRASEPPHEAIPLAVLADVEHIGDRHGVGVLALLNGDRRQAATYLAAGGESADLHADRAALALADGQPERALAIADAALTLDPHHGAALWNRALALRDLGLVRGAATSFREVVKLGEPGWAQEAVRRADALDTAADVAQQRFDRINAASAGLATGKLELSPDDARAQPGFARLVLYDAIRAADTPDRLAALEPLAAAIDAVDGDSAMADALARARRSPHSDLAQSYAQILRTLSVNLGITPRAGDEMPLPAGAARSQLLARARAAHDDDHLIGMLIKLGDDPYVVNSGEAAELVALTSASPDRWIQLLGVQQLAQVALKNDRLTDAEAILLRGEQRCHASAAPAYRCIKIAQLLGELYVKWHRLGEARRVLTAAWATTRASGEWILQGDILQQLAVLASFGDDASGSGLPLVRAYGDEVVRQFVTTAVDDRCLTEQWARDLRAALLIDQLAFAKARAELFGLRCAKQGGAEQAVSHLFVQSELLSETPSTDDDIAAFRAEVKAWRSSPETEAAEQIRLDQAEGRVVIDRDPAAGEALLRRAISAARTLPPSVTRAHQAKGFAYSVLVVAAAKRNNAAAALDLLADEQDLPHLTTCVAGVAIEDQRRAVVARDAAGKPLVHYDEDRTTTAIDASTLIPAQIANALAACPVIDVIARPPLHGSARLLPDTLAWRYLSRRNQPLAASSNRSVVVANVEPPAALELPRLAGWATAGVMIDGPSATPSRVLAAIGSAGDVVIHAHGIVDVAQPDASFLALSPDSDGTFALTAGAVRNARLAGSPLVILAACRASHAAPVWHEIWSLPSAFVYAGARAVIASAAQIPDLEAAAFFDIVRTKIRSGASVAVALRDARLEWISASNAERRGDWVRDVIVFE